MRVEDLFFVFWVCVLLWVWLLPVSVLFKLVVSAGWYGAGRVFFRLDVGGSGVGGDLGVFHGFLGYVYWVVWRVGRVAGVPSPPEGRFLVLRVGGDVYLAAVGASRVPFLARRRLWRAVWEALEYGGWRLEPAGAGVLVGWEAAAVDASSGIKGLGDFVCVVVEGWGGRGGVFQVSKGSGVLAFLAEPSLPARLAGEGEAGYAARVEAWRRGLASAWGALLSSAVPGLPRRGVRVGVARLGGEVRVPDGVHVAVFGQTGAGKSHLLKLLVGRLIGRCFLVVVDFTGEYGRCFRGRLPVVLPPDPLSVFGPVEAVEVLAGLSELYFGPRGELSPMVRRLILEAASDCASGGGLSCGCVASRLAASRPLREDLARAVDAAVSRVSYLLYEYGDAGVGELLVRGGAVPASAAAGAGGVARLPGVVFDVSGYPAFTQAVVGESVLAGVFKAARRVGGFLRPVCVVVDEAQRLAGSSGSSVYRGWLRRLLAEGRGYGVRVFLASQDPRLLGLVWGQAELVFVFRLYGGCRGVLPGVWAERCGGLGVGEALLLYRGGVWEVVVDGEAPRGGKGVLLEPRYLGMLERGIEGLKV